MKGTKILSILLVAVFAVSVLARVDRIPRDISEPFQKVWKALVDLQKQIDNIKFPAPAYDSGWVQIESGKGKQLDHNIGGNVDKYVVDMQFKSTTGNIHRRLHGGDIDSQGQNRGVSWNNLTTTSISVVRHPNDNFADKIRIRIWVYN